MNPNEKKTKKLKLSVAKYIAFAKLIDNFTCSTSLPHLLSIQVQSVKVKH